MTNCRRALELKRLRHSLEMPKSATQSASEGPIRVLRLLFWLRSFSIASQIVLVVAVHYGLRLPLPLLPLGAAIAALIIWNSLVYPRIRENPQVSYREVLLNLLVDIAAFTVIMYFAGGSTNPFVSLYLVPIGLAAAALPARYAWLIVVVCAACYTFVVLDHVPLPSVKDRFGGDFNLHITGMWVNFLFAATLMAVFIGAMARSVRQRDQDLVEMREQAMRDQQIVALGTLAAGTAHELNTPLSTLRLLVEEVEESLEADELKPQLRAMNGELKVISERLNTMVDDAGVTSAKAASRGRLSHFIDSVTRRWSAAHPDVNTSIRWREPFEDPEVVTEVTIGQAILNVLDNAAQATAASGGDSVRVELACRDEHLTIEILDEGGGLGGSTPEFLGQRIGSSKKDGLGVGLLLSRASMRRYGGDIELHEQEKGVAARIELPLGELVIRDE